MRSVLLRRSAAFIEKTREPDAMHALFDLTEDPSTHSTDVFQIILSKRVKSTQMEGTSPEGYIGQIIEELASK